MKTTAIALAIGTMLTVEQRDMRRSHHDYPSAAVSADGRFVAFTTYSRLVPADTDDWSDVYVLDRTRQHVTLESADTLPYTGDAAHPGISGDGRYLVYQRASVVVSRDRERGVTSIIGPGDQPAITENGNIAVFSAVRFDAALGGDINGDYSDVYALDLPTGHAQRISVDSGLPASLTDAAQPAASRDGRYVAFSSRVHARSRHRSSSQVFVRDTRLHTTRAVGAGWEPSISGDGGIVAFVSVRDDVPHIVVADLQAGESRIITKSVRRGLANGGSAKPQISSDGRFVAFQSEASDLVADEDINLLWDVFLFDRTTGEMTRVSSDPDAEWMESSGGPSIDARGSIVAFSSRHPTGASDKRNDFDLYVATISGPRLP